MVPSLLTESLPGGISDRRPRARYEISVGRHQVSVAVDMKIAVAGVQPARRRSAPQTSLRPGWQNRDRCRCAPDCPAPDRCGCRPALRNRSPPGLTHCRSRCWSHWPAASGKVGTCALYPVVLTLARLLAASFQRLRARQQTGTGRIESAVHRVELRRGLMQEADQSEGRHVGNPRG